MNSFLTTQLPPIHFGLDALASLPNHALACGHHALLLHGALSLNRSGSLEKIKTSLIHNGVQVFTGCIVGEPNVEGIDALVQQARSSKIDHVIAVGGGSVLDAAKAIAAMATVQGSVVEYLEGIGSQKHPGSCLPWIAVPTTAGTGSEASTNAVVKGTDANGVPYKRSIRHPQFLPKAIILDPSLQLGMPRAITVACAMDAFSQLLESYTSVTANSITDAIVWAGIEHMHQGLAMLDQGDSQEMRGHFSLAALSSGYGLANAGLGLVHGVAGLLGAMREIPHGVVCGTLIAPAFHATIQACHESTHTTALAKFQKVARLFGGERAQDLGPILFALVEKFEIPRLSQFGFTDSDLQEVASKGSNRNSPAPVSPETILYVLCSRL